MKRPFQLGDKVRSEYYGVGEIMEIRGSGVWVLFNKLNETLIFFNINGEFFYGKSAPERDIRHLSKLERQLK